MSITVSIEPYVHNSRVVVACVYGGYHVRKDACGCGESDERWIDLQS
jgi:hypothetical protein